MNNDGVGARSASKGKSAPSKISMSSIAYHIVWTTYGTWLHGDSRGWIEKNKQGIRPPNREREVASRRRMVEEVVELTSDERAIIDQTIRRHCEIRDWQRHALNVRSNHVHVVVTADCDADEVMNQLKAWCSRKLSDSIGLMDQVAKKAGRRRWFTEAGNKESIKDDAYFCNAVKYVLERQ
jgi:REP element-mobilizing transposase RayT